MDVACQKVKQLPCMAHADFMDVCARIMHTILESIMCVAWQVLPSISSREGHGFVLSCDAVQLPIIDTKSDIAIFTNTIGEVHGLLDGWITSF